MVLKQLKIAKHSRSSLLIGRMVLHCENTRVRFDSHENVCVQQSVKVACQCLQVSKKKKKYIPKLGRHWRPPPPCKNSVASSPLPGIEIVAHSICGQKAKGERAEDLSCRL